VTEAVGIALIVIGIVVLLVLGARRPKRESALKIKQPPPAQPPPVPPPTLEDSIWAEVNGLPLPEDDTAGAWERKRLQEKAVVEKRRRWLRPFGVFGRLVTYAVLFLLLYAYSPDDISRKPFASLTLHDVFGTVAWVVITLVLFKALFEPSGEDDIKDAWGWLGVVIAGLMAVAVFYFGFHDRTLVADH
jgi:hypothetical protein